ncbi:TIM barrel protein [Vallitalea okinawensis]|uniref:TIM barrel protein n=1 Tax=Vallitalea okinawensis TaxID=2078660 RepID=UPI000CFB80B8|nr:TIM barrel protein [Vallitalea okinawensis]
MSQFKFSVGPWNVHEGGDAFGPTVRDSISFEEKIKRFSELGFSAIQFHDDDAVPNMNELTEDEIKAEARKVKALLDKYSLKAEFVAPRLWEDDHTHDGGYTSMSQVDRDFAMWRSYRSIDIAKELDCDKIVLWLAREGTLCYESKDPVVGVNHLVDSINKMLDYDDNIKVLIEPKPNEPIDRSFCPTIGHVMGISSRTNDPSRVGGLLESAHAILAGIDPANEMAFALSFDKLWGVHLNDQNGMKYDQDKSFGSENLRQAFNQVRVLVENDFGKNGEYVGLDVKAMRTQKIEDCYRHLENSMRVVRLMEEKVKQFDYELQKKYIEERNYEALEMYVIELLLGL